MALRKARRGTLVERDFGWATIVQELRRMDGSYTKVGFPEEGKVGSKRKKGSDHPDYTDISEIALIASWLHFGTKDIDPGWPFLSGALDENLQGLIALRDKLYIQVVNGKILIDKALAIMGEYVVSKTKKKIVDTMYPPNAPRTIAKKKGIDNPLIDTGQLLNSVQHIEVIT